MNENEIDNHHMKRCKVIGLRPLNSPGGGVEGLQSVILDLYESKKLPTPEGRGNDLIEEFRKSRLYGYNGYLIIDDALYGIDSEFLPHKYIIPKKKERGEYLSFEVCYNSNQYSLEEAIGNALLDFRDGIPSPIYDFEHITLDFNKVVSVEAIKTHAYSVIYSNGRMSDFYNMECSNEHENVHMCPRNTFIKLWRKLKEVSHNEY